MPAPGWVWYDVPGAYWDPGTKTWRNADGTVARFATGPGATRARTARLRGYQAPLPSPLAPPMPPPLTPAQQEQLRSRMRQQQRMATARLRGYQPPIQPPVRPPIQAPRVPMMAQVPPRPLLIEPVRPPMPEELPERPGPLRRSMYRPGYHVRAKMAPPGARLRGPGYRPPRGPGEVPMTTEYAPPSGPRPQEPAPARPPWGVPPGEWSAEKRRLATIANEIAAIVQSLPADSLLVDPLNQVFYALYDLISDPDDTLAQERLLDMIHELERVYSVYWRVEVDPHTGKKREVFAPGEKENVKRAIKVQNLGNAAYKIAIGVM